MKSLAKITSLSQKNTAPRPAPRPQPAAAPSQDQGFVCVLLLSTPCWKILAPFRYVPIWLKYQPLIMKLLARDAELPAGWMTLSSGLAGRLANKGCMGR